MRIALFSKQFLLALYMYILLPLPYLQYECVLSLKSGAQTCEYKSILSNGLQFLQNLAVGQTPELIFIIGNVIAFMITFLISTMIISYSKKGRKR